MAKEYTIKIVFDDSKVPGQSSNVLIPKGVYDPSIYTVLLNPYDAKESMIENAAHELGHVLGRIFKTPAHMNDPRVSKSQQEDYYSWDSPYEAQRKYTSEQEAWELGKKMVPINPRSMKRKLDTYKP